MGIIPAIVAQEERQSPSKENLALWGTEIIFKGHCGTFSF